MTTQHPGDVGVDALTEFFGEAIHIYTRADAISDGLLRDVSAFASEAGFRYPVALTVAAWSDAVAWNYGPSQDEDGRLWDVLTMARHAIQTTQNDPRSLHFQVLRIPNSPHATRPRLTDLVMHAGPGDNAEPVITITRPGED